MNTDFPSSKKRFYFNTTQIRKKNVNNVKSIANETF